MKKTVLLLIMSIALFGCGQDAIDDGMSTEEVKAIASASNIIVQNAIQNAINDGIPLDPVQIAEQISQIDGVISARPNVTQSGIVVTLEGELTIVDLLFNKADAKLYVEEAGESESETSVLSRAIRTKETTSNITMPKGNGRALILAPFQHTFKSDLDYLNNRLEAAGYKVDSFLDKNATIQRFRGDFLSQYDIVIIDSHGGLGGYTYLYTAIATSSKYSKEFWDAVPKKERSHYAYLACEGDVFIALTPQFLRATTTKNFKDTWILNLACEGAFYDEGEASLSEAFLDL
jgi:hypothetical protein